MSKRILKYCFFLILLVSTSAITCVEAARLRNFPVTVTQPDGVVIHCLASGDEFYNWLHDENGFTIIQDPVTGYYTYAVIHGGKLVSSGLTVGKVNPASMGLPSHAIVFPPRASLGARQGSPLNPGSILNAPRTGTLNNIVIFIRFIDDSEFTDAISPYDTMFNSTAGGTSSLRNYYVEASYSQLTISTTFYPAPSGGIVTSYQDSHPRNYYRPYNAATNLIGYSGEAERTSREHTLLANAVNAVGPQVPPGLNIDGDGDGNVDNVCFVIKGAPEGWNDLLWPHMWSLETQSVYINSKRVFTYNFQLEEGLEVNSVGVLAHEMFHSLGAPDLYHYTVDLQYPAAEWDVMDMDLNPPQHMTAYMKMRYGTWLASIPTLSASGTYSLNPLTSSTNNAFKISSPYSTTEYFVVEYRKKTGTFESSLPGEGLIVYRINSARDGQGNADGPPDELYVYRPDGTLFSNGDSTTANFNSTVGRTAINDLTNPSSFLSTGWAGGLNISSIGTAGTTISFNVSFPLAEQVNLAAYKPPGWSDKIVVSKVTGTTTDDSPIYPTDALYIDWAVINAGGGPTATRFYTDLYVDGIPKHSWPTDPPLNAGSVASVLDYPIGTLSAGVHTIQIITDSTFAINEGNESDNMYFRMITVSPIQPNLAAHQPAAWSDKIVVSRVAGTTTDSTVLLSTDSLYVDWAVINNGVAATAASFYTYLYVDAVQKSSWRTDPPLNIGSYASASDYSIGTLSAGTHVISITTDPTMVIAESNENDNMYFKTITVSAPGPPNMTPYKPPGWSDKIVVSNVTGTTTDTALLCSTDSLYLDWAVTNSGTSPVAVDFYTKLLVDNVLKTSWQKPPLDLGAYTTLTDYSLGSLGVGAHTLQIVTDSTGVVAESNETDNQYTKAINIQNCSCSALTTHVNPQGTGTVQVVTAPNCGGGKLGEGLRPGPMAMGSSPTGGDMARSEQTIRNFGSLRARAQATGSAKVIVGLRLNFRPEGLLGNPGAVQMQRNQIAQAQEGLLKALTASSMKSVKRFKYIPYIAMEVDGAGLEKLQGLSQVISLEEDVAYPAALAESMPLIGGTTAWATGYTGAGQAVAILDTGTDKTHPFLSGKVVSEACYSTNGTSTVSLCPGGVSQSTAPGSGVPCGIEGCKHGTHTAGIAAGKGTEYSGVAKDANIIAIQVFTQFNSPSDCGGAVPCVMSYVSDQTLGLERVLELSSSLSIASVNISIGGGKFATYCDTEEPAAKAAIDNLRAAGIATAISSGNNGYSDGICGMACMSSAISVGSTDDGSLGTTADAISDYSNSAPILNLLAPGRWITSSVPGGGFETLSGTSMSAPHVAGAFAVLKSKLPSLTVDQMLGALTTTGVMVADERNGLVRPRIQLDAALNYLDVVSFNNGTVVTLTAAPVEGYKFVSWTNCDTPSGSSCTVTMNQARAVTANFEVSSCPAISVNPATLPDGLVGAAYNQTVTASGGAPPYSFAVTVGSVPGGLTLSSGGALSGTPTSANTFPFTVTATDANTCTGSRPYTVSVSDNKAVMTSPTPGSTLTSSTETFNWTAGTGVVTYSLYVGHSVGAGDIYIGNFGTNLSGTISGLPSDGTTLYVRLYSLISGTWQFNDYTYTAASANKAVMVSPVPGSTLTSSTETFTWSAGAGASMYAMYVGTTAGGTEIYADVQGTSLSRTLQGLPTDGRTLHVRLWSLISGVWQFNDYTYTAASASKAVMVSPTPGSTFMSATVTFTWSAGSGASMYALYVGTTAGGTEIYADVQGTSLSRTLQGLPTNGIPVYVRLWSLIGGGWQFNDYSYTAVSSSKAAMTDPPPGSTLTSATVTFTWSAGSGASMYALYVGTTAGGTEIYADVQGVSLSRTVGGLPTNGSPVYVRLWSLIGGGWQFNDYTYTAVSAGKAAMTTPAPGSTFTSSTVTFTWSAGSGASMYALYVGTTAGGTEIYADVQGVNLSRTLGGLPTNGSLVYVRLWSLIGGAWQFNDYTYTTCSGCQ